MKKTFILFLTFVFLTSCITLKIDGKSYRIRKIIRHSNTLIEGYYRGYFMEPSYSLKLKEHNVFVLKTQYSFSHNKDVGIWQIKNDTFYLEFLRHNKKNTVRINYMLDTINYKIIYIP